MERELSAGSSPRRPGKADWDDRSWPRGTIVLCEGRVGRLATAPDKHGQVKLEWADGSKSAFVRLSAVRRGTEADWEDACQDEAERQQQLHQEKRVKALERRTGGAPPPRGVRNAMELTGEAELKIAFEMLDDRREGALDRAQARCWLRCAGWCVPDEELDEMLSGASGARGVSRGGAQTGRTKWGLRNLLEVLAQNRHRENSSVEALQAALRRLANNRTKIPRERLLEFTTQAHDLTEANLSEVLSSLGLASVATLDCDTLAARLLERVCSPPSVLDMNSFEQ